MNLGLFISQATEIKAKQDYISTSDSDGPDNRMSFTYDIVLTDNYWETVSSYEYFMNLAASLGSLSQVVYCFKIKNVHLHRNL